MELLLQLLTIETSVLIYELKTEIAVAISDFNALIIRPKYHSKKLTVQLQKTTKFFNDERLFDIIQIYFKLLKTGMDLATQGLLTGR